MLLSDVIGRVRRDIGDPLQNFRTTTTGDGLITWFDLPRQNVDPATLIVEISDGISISTLYATSLFTAWSAATAYVPGNKVIFNGFYFISRTNNTNSQPSSSGLTTTDWTAVTAYTLDSVNGQLALSSPVPEGSTLMVIGNSWSLFTDAELTDIVTEAVYQHTFGQTTNERFRDALTGAITYRHQRITLDNLPVMQEPLIVMLTDINALWILATDAATDVNIQTAEGTNVDRSARYTQLMGHIQSLTERYQEYCGQLNVGLFRMETLNLRRVSRTTGRLVPIFTDREYDNHEWPQRQLPQIDTRNEDNSGIPSPLWNGTWGP